ncbi:MAG TPA: TonB-dependent receptor [Gemmatimonadaceae bacterium]|nr:TonB-dependent receptor [Gemmatimonadaceae bacterium]
MMLRFVQARRLRRHAASLLALLAVPFALHAQVGASTDIITGVVKTPAGVVVENAQVEAQSTETQVTRRQRTNAQGKYTILFPDGGGTYRLTVRYIGFQPTTLTVTRNGDDDRIVRNVTLGQSTAQTLARVEVRGRRQPQQQGPGGGPPTPGASERVVAGDQAARLPVDASDPTAIAALAPGVVLTGADTAGGGGAANFSVAGQSSQSNNVTLDGLSFAAGFVPQDAIRGTRVVTNTYDVARGQFSGGQVSQTTRSGTNVLQGSLSYVGRYRDFTVEQGGTTGAFGGAYNQNQFGAGIGFPIIKDKLFFFGALQGRRRADLLPSLLAADDATRARLGASPDSVNRFLGLVNRYGVAGAGGVIDDNRNADNMTVLGRMDYSVTDAHTLTLRGDWRLVDQTPTRVGSLALPQTGGTTANRGGGGSIVLSSRFGTGVINELRAGLQVDNRTGSPFITLPLGRVQVLSDIDDGTQGFATLQFGGSTSLLSQSDNTVFEATNETSLLLDEGKHRVKVGGLINRTGYTQDQAFNRFGTFTFNSLADFESNMPATFQRTLASPQRTGSTTNSGFYVGDTWRPRDGLQLVLGARFEGSSFDGAPARNLAVDSAFGRRTDVIPSDAALLPRVGFSWSKAQPENANGGNPFGNGALTIRGGVGRFRDAPNTQLFAGAQTATGLATGEQAIFCVGGGVPMPDWNGYFANPATIPTECLAGGPPAQRNIARNVTTFDSDYSNPRAWRGSIGASKRIIGRFSLNVDVSGALGEAQTGYRDLNLNTTPQFTLAEEGNRPIFVPASSIITTTGAVPTQLSRLDQRFGSVYDVNSRNKTKQWQGTVSFGGFTSRGAIVNTSYTYSDARSQTGFGFGGAGGGFSSATTVGNPNDVEWARSAFNRNHNFIATVTHPLTSSFEITAIGRMTSGSPFTPLVSADINGDGARNDRAFIYDPATAGDPDLAAGMNKLLASRGNTARQCLESQLGSLSSRNSCTGPWQPGFDLQLNWRPTMFKLDRRLTFSLVTANLIGGIDQALHGSSNLRGWGSFTQPDNTLLFVRGFDASTNRYRYEVNERFGATRGNQTGIRLPFQVGFNIRYTLGPDQTRDRLRAVFGATQGGRLTGEGIAAGVGRFFPNVPLQIIEARDSIGLTDVEVTKLKVLADSVQVQVDSLIAQARAVVEKEGGNPDPAVLFGVRLRPFLERGTRLRTAGLEGAKAILTAEQWTRVPTSIKTPQGFGGPGGGGGRRPGN